MRATLTIIIALGVVGTATGRDDKQPVKLDGTYLIVGVEIGGKALPAEFITKQPESERTITFKGDKMTVGDKLKDKVVTIKLDPSKTPARLTLTGKTPDGRDDINYGVYKVDGDTLTICATTSGAEADQPKEFKTAPKSNTVLMILNKKDK